VCVCVCVWLQVVKSLPPRVCVFLQERLQQQNRSLEARVSESALEVQRLEGQVKDAKARAKVSKCV
jgi:hypothetical protein